MRDRESRLGHLVKSTALATVPRSEDTVQTIVRVDFEKGSVFNIYIWGPRRILGILAMPELPPLRFLPVSDHAFTAYSLDAGGSGQTLTVATSAGETVLMLPTPSGPIAAHKDGKGR